MTAYPATRLRMTPEEYFAWSEEQEDKYLYWDGEVYPVFPPDSPSSDMAGATKTHVLLVSNVVFALRLALRGRGCLVLPSDMRVQLTEEASYVYPDVAVVCGAPEFLDERETTLLNPTLIVEVLSPSTARFDRGKKLQAYRRLPSVQEVVLVAQDYKGVEVVRRKGENWVLVDPDAKRRLTLDSVEAELRVAEVYEGVDVPDEGRPPGEPVTAP